MHREVPPPIPAPEGRAVALIVTSDSDLARSVGKTLASVGHQVEAASSAREALRHLFLAERHHALLIVDASLPGLPVREWLSVVAAYFGRRTAVVALAREADGADALGAVRRHCHEALAWPAEPPALLAAVGRATRRLPRARAGDAHVPHGTELERRIGHLVDEWLQVSGLVRVDGLTGLPDRRRLEEDFLVRRAAAQRSRASFGVVLLDIDRFRRFNELHRHGYAGGDDALRFVAHTLAASCRLGDAVYRSGGDEFVVVLDGVTLGDFVAAAERLRAEVLAGAQRALLDDSLRTLTVSLGVAVVRPEESGDLGAMLAVAARRLAEARAAGGNAVRPVAGGGAVRAASA